MLLPKKVKHRKWHKPRRNNKGVATRANTVAFGSFGLKSMDNAWVTSRQIESARRVLTRYVRRGGKIWIRIFPDRPVTTKGNEMPMGKGKGTPDHYVCTVKPGTVMFEMAGVSDDKAVEALVLAGHKLPLKAKVVKK
ncbi:MAG: 50S ribosomal protein L16 [Candidatus Magasanikbacteria bacterium RIFOXYC2_FULL_40_16]|uniref:Large ribosomal subunit protein uL16 n=3 Tax=Candidatus Magasanikiibacteriota TaxID=1752731 RepID=A0A1F6NHI3_9BACT|nr:MAG: 50S ribosomal protein L16 [Candidatus Magasanikbacteria bacterium RIFOXYA2_FULL_40_20]OGH83223.1 MAG: 50S ribosomal protein L16 [Candidatus Magasanikbacteria bacterium RIFOXYB1_FULL_40_15]OGH85155.1 MAG: 50S ribosomal protein L16 [Candidatus Magasanikbacteria bacterium RIFOXYB2_FULL_40_13]OGH87287.1 MAG: 50S ribosomal protein L16 [Candidatus Magasanikbacteria bacterium RIFOXYA1_FULL_40_8]OGH89506.1 MAG: 50S ribosomal protein L16 [Candidatus Magasanikbacteria bacterium RIFOXYC2_FULL_40_1